MIFGGKFSPETKMRDNRASNHYRIYDDALGNGIDYVQSYYVDESLQS